jgi:hypothetical protein
MAAKLYLILSGFIFLLVGIFHLLRVVYHWPIVIGTWTIPFVLSYVGFPAATGYSAWALWLLRRMRIPGSSPFRLRGPARELR